jgi:hypothetical protein
MSERATQTTAAPQQLQAYAVESLEATLQRKAAALLTWGCRKSFFTAISPDRAKAVAGETVLFCGFGIIE